MIYCTLLNPALDLTYPINNFLPGGTYRDIPAGMTPAGKGLNVANMVRILGEEACVFGIIPECDLARFDAHCEEMRISHSFFPVAEISTRLNVTVCDSPANATTHINSLGSPLGEKVQDDFLKFAASHMTEGDQWCFSGSLPPGFDTDFYSQLIKLCKVEKATTFLDTRGKGLKLGARAKPLVLKPNSTELEELFGEQIKGVHHMALKGKKLLDQGVAYVYISLGSDGMIALHDNECLLCSPPQVRTTDTVGCGDALMAGVLVAWKRKFSFSESCRLAVACGTSKAMDTGPHSMNSDTVWQLMEDVKITAI